MPLPTHTHTPSPRRHRCCWFLRAIAALMAFVMCWSIIEARTLRVMHTTFSHPDVPVQFDGTRIVFVSDVHAGPFFSRARVARLIDLVNAQHPDIVVLGGDYVGGYSGGFDAFYSEARRLRPSIATVAVLGNHDNWEGALRSRAGLREINATLLDNRNVRVTAGDASIRIAGVEDLDTGTPNVAEAASGIPAGEFAMLVTHNPDVIVRQMAPHARAFDLVLAGHTHGGQATLFGLWAPFAPTHYKTRFLHRWSRQFGVQTLVSHGVGTINVPLRFCAQPQIEVITLEHGPGSVAGDR